MTPRAKWTDADVADLRARLASGETREQIMAATGRSYGSVDNAITRYVRGPQHPLATPTDPTGVIAELQNDEVSRWQRLAEAEASRERKLAEAFEWLRPVHMDPPPRAKVRVAATQTTLVVGDAHFGHQCEATLTVIGHVLEAIRPHRFIWNGDLFDLHFLSAHPKDKRRSWEPRVEVAAFQRWQRQYQEASDAWGMTWHATHANHDGDSPESRWWRYLNSRCPELLAHPDAERRLSFAEWFFPEWAPITQAAHIDVQHLRVFHGYRAQRHGGRTAMAHADDWSHDVVTSHTHRAGSGYRLLPATPSRPAAVREWHEIGCACLVQPSYTDRPHDAVNGFALIHEDAASGMAQVEVVKVVGGKAIVGALQRRIAA